MADESWPDIERVFLEALEKPAEERGAFLDEACSDPAQRREVESLLASHDEAGDFLGTEQQDRSRTLLEPEPPLPAGERVGAYRVVSELGRGGMGIVYLAERADGQFEQQVALKLLKRGMDSDEILRRFLMERQILARLEHPHIARLLDGGITDGGQPYFAMEHVSGTPVVEFCERRGLDIETRLRLFLDICDAVQYAHRKLVVHRDLKPSNILVNETGEVKLLDFGIAKLLDAGERGDRTMTRAGARLVTPEYGSPEQLRGEPVTTATDVYALGVVLYEVLTGRRPYRSRERTPEAMVQVMRDTRTTRPSRVAGSVRLQRRLAGDLDTIVLKALRQEPERRYASVEALREDISAHLDGQPVKARGDSVAYISVKFVRRHRVAVLAAALVLVALVGGLSAALWQARVASLEAAKANEIQEFLVEMFRGSDPGEALGEDLSARDLLERGAERIDSELGGQPEVQGRMMWLIGSLFENLGHYDRAIAMYELSLETRRRVFGEMHPDVALSLSSLGSTLREKGEFAEAEPMLRRALEIRRRTLGDNDSAVGESMNNLGLMLAEGGEYEESVELLTEAVALYRRVFGDEHERVSNALSNLAQIVKWKGDYARAEPLYREALAMRRKFLGDEHPRVAITMSNLGSLLLSKGDFASAEPMLTESLAIRRKVLGDGHPDVALNLNNLGGVFSEQGKHEEAAPLFREAWDMHRQIYGERNWRVAGNIHNLAGTLTSLHRYDEAEPLFAEAISQRREILGNDHPRLADSLTSLATLRIEQGDLAAAEQLVREALAIREQAGQENHPKLAWSLVVKGRLLLRQGRPVEAESPLREAMRIRDDRLTEDHWRRFEVRALLGESLLGQQRYADAEPLLVTSAQRLDEILGGDADLTRHAQEQLAALRIATGQSD